MEQVEVDGRRIAYHRRGDGPPLVLVHGFVGDGLSTWSRQLSDLSDDFTVIAWDAPGAGHSADPPDRFRILDYADCLAAFVRELNLPHPHLVGLSFGGALLLELYRRHPTIPRTLVLASAYAGWRGSLDREAVAERVRASLRLAELPAEQFASHMMSSMFSESTPAEAVTAFEVSVRGFSRKGFLAMMWSSAEADLSDMLGSITVPTLLLYGDRDIRAPLTIAHRLRAEIAGSTLVVMPGVGHVSPVEAPELFNRELRTFLRNVDGVAPADQD